MTITIKHLQRQWTETLKYMKLLYATIVPDDNTEEARDAAAHQADTYFALADKTFLEEVRKTSIESPVVAPAGKKGPRFVSWLQPILADLVDKTKLDGKFYGAVFRHKDDSLVDPQDYVVFLARDKAFLPTLQFYREECERQGAAQAQVEMKLPDVDPGELSW